MTDEEFGIIKISIRELLKRLEDEEEELYDDLWIYFLQMQREKYNTPDYNKILIHGTKNKFLSKEELDGYIYDKIAAIYNRVLDCEESFDGHMIV
tara:strand:+ start:289 stop:573 length:285 start_codon:yes stop_codon:yes gene_type:complete